MSAQVGASLWLGVFEGRLRACFAGLAGQVAACGAAYFPAGVCASKLGGLLDEATARALRPASPQVGAVRQRAELAVFEPAAANAVTRAAAELRALVAARAGRFGGQGFAVNELTLPRPRRRHQRPPRPRPLPALDRRAVASGQRQAGDRRRPRRVVDARVVALPAGRRRAAARAGLGGLDDGRPLHLVEAEAGERLSLSLRMDSRRDP